MLGKRWTLPSFLQKANDSILGRIKHRSSNFGELGHGMSDYESLR
jgi:hypothetical protein